MKRLIMLSAIVLMLLAVAGCAQQEAKGPAPPLENQMSEAHQEFLQKKQFGKIAFSVCGGLVVCGVLFKLGAIVTGFISGRRIGKKVRKAKEARAKEAWREDMTDYQIESQRHKEYMEERMKEKKKSPRP